MGRRRDTRQSAAVHGGQIRFRMPACRMNIIDEQDWDVLSISTADSFEVIGSGYCQASAELNERHRCILGRQRNKRAAAWSLEQDLRDRLSQHRVQVRVVSADGCALRATVRCWFEDLGPEAQKRLHNAFERALAAFSARNEEAARCDTLAAIARRHSPADHELSRSSWVRQMGISVRPPHIGFFCAFPWEVSVVTGAQLVQAEQLLSLNDPPSARIDRRAAPQQCSARAGRRRSRLVQQSTERGLRTRARAEAVRARGMKRRRSADEKQRERDLFVDVPVIARRGAPETVVSYSVAHESSCGSATVARQVEDRQW